MSKINWVYPLPANASIEQSVFGTIAILEVVKPSRALKVGTDGCCRGSPHNVRYPKEPLGTAVSLNVYAAELARGAHELDAMFTVNSPLKGWPLLLRLSKARQGAVG
jgi:hypothetical protein